MPTGKKSHQGAEGFLQRAPKGAQPVTKETDRYWAPEGAILQPGPEDAYVVVDDLTTDEQGQTVQIAVLAIATWPHLDALGRLSFDEAGSGRLAVDPVWLQERVDQERLANEPPGEPRISEQELRTRPLRIGDTFLIRGLEVTESGTPPSWKVLEDVSASARDRAKIAQYAAVAPSVDRDRAQELGVSSEEPSRDRPERPGPSAARPAV
jgi:hypothetical protein